MPVRKKPRPKLTDEQLRELLATSRHHLREIYPQYPRIWLEAQKQIAARRFPEYARRIKNERYRQRTNDLYGETELTQEQIAKLARMSHDDAAALLPHIPFRRLRTAISRYLAEHPDIAAEVAITNHKRSVSTAAMRRQVVAAREESEKLRAELESRDNLSAAIRPGVFRIGEGRKSDSHEATAIALWSDWHFEEIVDFDAMNGLNKYNPEIAHERARQCIINTAKLILKEARYVKIRNVILALMGDFISGMIHDELTSTNAVGPNDAILMVQQVLHDGIVYMQEKLGKNIKLTIVCKAGNHGRFTKKSHSKDDQANNLEWAMYHTLAQRLKDAAYWIIDRGDLSYLDVHGHICRFHHGHSVTYKGGIGGIAIPMHRRLHAWDVARQARYNFNGHFHHFYDGGNFLSNGSLIGSSEYSIRIGAIHEPPRQAMCLIDSKHGKTGVWPIIVEE